MFIAEAKGLQAIAATASILVPGIICYGLTQQENYLVLEYLALGKQRNETLFGQPLAGIAIIQLALHPNTIPRIRIG